jgi:hypothetical protein
VHDPGQSGHDRAAELVGVHEGSWKGAGGGAGRAKLPEARERINEAGGAALARMAPPRATPFPLPLRRARMPGDIGPRPPLTPPSP